MPEADKFKRLQITRNMPAEEYDDATLDVDLDPVPRGFYAGSDGTIIALNGAGNPITFPGIKGGVTYAIRLKHIVSVGTSVTPIILLF